MKTVLIVFAIIAALGIGYVVGTMKKTVDEKMDVVKEAVEPSKADSVITTNTNKATNITGHFILAESNCAGFTFIDNKIVLWTNEMACFAPDTLKIRWLSDSLFMTRSTMRMTEGCPPQVDFYQVLSFDGKQLNLKSVWTGWNDLADDHLQLTKQPD